MQIQIVDERITLEMLKPQTPGSAGIDLRACIDKDLILAPGQTEAIKLGVKIFIEDPNIAGFLLPRSGLGHKHGIVLGNLVGLLDSDYQGEWQMSCWNRGHEPFKITPLQRVCQVMFGPVIHPKFEVVNEFKKTERGEGGLGHTGKQ